MSKSTIPFSHSSCSTTQKISRSCTDRLVLAIGGAGCNIATMLSQLSDIKIVCINTHISSLGSHPSFEHLTIGLKTCKGMAANVPDRGKRAAEESIKEIEILLSDLSKIFIIAGLGGGTGSGALPVIANLAQSMGITIHIAVTMPFKVESQRRNVAIMTKEWLCSSPHEIYIYDFSSQQENHALEYFNLETIIKNGDRSICNKVTEWMR